MNNLLIWIYVIIDIITFFYLSYVDWHQTSNFLSFIVCLVVNGFLGTIWPIYWGFLHWIF